MTSPKQKPLIGWMIFEEYDDDFSNWDGHIAYPNPTGANLAWLNPIKMIEHSAYTALEKENAELKNQVSGLQYNYSHAKDNERELLKQRDELKAEQIAHLQLIGGQAEEIESLRAKLETAVTEFKAGGGE